MYAPVDLDGQVSIVVDVPTEVYELVHLAGCLKAEEFRKGRIVRITNTQLLFSLQLCYRPTRRPALLMVGRRNSIKIRKESHR